MLKPPAQWCLDPKVKYPQIISEMAMDFGKQNTLLADPGGMQPHLYQGSSRDDRDPRQLTLALYGLHLRQLIMIASPGLFFRESPAIFVDIDVISTKIVHEAIQLMRFERSSQLVIGGTDFDDLCAAWCDLCLGQGRTAAGGAE